MNRYFLWGLYALLAFSCTTESTLEQALRLSGDNREHLEQVLRHYSRYPQDSLKYRAARFLIENMPGHGWYEGEDLDAYHRLVDSVYADQDYLFKATLYEIYFQWPEVFDQLTFYEDIEHLDSTFLITHIDSTFSAAARRPWLQMLTFKQFCEYILPYRVGHERPRLLYPLQDSIYRAEVEKMLGYDDVIKDAFLIFNLKSPYLFTQTTTQSFYHGHSLYTEMKGCVAQAQFSQWRAKLLMCPIVTDLIPAYPYRNDRHCWSAIIDNTQMSGVNGVIHSFKKYGKVYRRTFSRSLLPGLTTDSKEYVPLFFREPFYRDVTRSYTSTSDVTVRPMVPVSASRAYLCVFNDLKWEPLACAPQKKDSFHFQDLGRGIVYLPVVYPDEKAVAISYPFLLHPTGKVQIFRPDTTRLMTLRLDRKYPLSHTVKLSNQSFSQAFVEASNDSCFRQADSLGSFGEISLRQYSSAEFFSSKPYRYWRIRSSQSFAMGEYLLYDTGGKCVIPTENLRAGYREAFDNNPISYVYSDRSNTFMIDLGRATALSKVECLLRNDGNTVWPRHWYELFYHNGTEWYSLGVKEATNRWVEFDSIPANALLWLRDLTTGKQERVFTIKNGHIYFW